MIEGQGAQGGFPGPCRSEFTPDATFIVQKEYEVIQRVSRLPVQGDMSIEILAMMTYGDK